MNLRERRKAKGISQAELARRVGRSAACMSLYEIGKRTPPPAMLSMIEKAIDGYEGVPHARRVPFKNEAEKADLRRIWCERYGETIRHRDERDARLGERR